MPRPRFYSTPAQRQAAYRARRERDIVLVYRCYWDEHNEQLEQLLKAVKAARSRGDEFAAECVAIDVDKMLVNMTSAFNRRAKKLDE